MERTGAVTRGRDPKLEAKSSYGLLRYDSFALPPYLYYSKPLQELEALRTIIPTPTQTTGPEETPGTGASKKKKKKSDSVNRSNANPATQATNHLSELQAALSRITAGTSSSISIQLDFKQLMLNRQRRSAATRPLQRFHGLSKAASRFREGYPSI